MFAILVRACCFIAIILMGIVLRKIGFFKEEDFHLLSKIVIRITLTASIIRSFSGKELRADMFLLTLIGFGFNCLLMLCGYLQNKARGKDAQAFAIINTSGCNIGNFVLPFAQSFLGATGVMAVSLFDVGNSIICLGGSYGIASVVADEHAKFSLKPLLKSLTKSVPLMTYITMTILCLFHISFPKPVMELVGTIADANAFLAMLMIGVGFKLSGEPSQKKDILRTLSLRYALGSALALISWFLLPFPLEYRQALVILSFAPIASAAPAFTAQINGDFGLASAINSIAILISIVLITAALIFVA